jgi:cytochrome c oxidase cbb3-type subunit III
MTLASHSLESRLSFMEDSTLEDSPPVGIAPAAARLIFVAMLGLIAGGFVAFRLLSKPVGPPPPEVAKDVLLTQGRVIYLARCAACHGNDGRGDGPIARDLVGPPVGNLTDNEWKHGDRPDQVMGVIAKGVPETRMTGWSNVLDPPELKAAAAYVYYLAKHAVPEELRQP